MIRKTLICKTNTVMLPMEPDYHPIPVIGTGTVPQPPLSFGEKLQRSEAKQLTSPYFMGLSCISGPPREVENYEDFMGFFPRFEGHGAP